MILKVVSVLFAAVFLFKILFARRLRGLGKELDLVANIFLGVVGVYVVIAGAFLLFSD